MRRAELYSACDNVINLLRRYDLSSCFNDVMSRDDRIGGTSRVSILTILRDYTVDARSLGSTEREVIHMLGLDDLEDVNLWLVMVTDGNTPYVQSVSMRVSAAVQVLPSYLLLLARGSDSQGGEPASAERLTVVIVDDSDGASPARLISVLRAVSDLYETYATLYRLPSDGLRVASCDSGSDKSFDFLGIPKLISGIKELIFGVWDRLVYFHERRIMGRLELVAGSLPIIASVDELKRSGALTSEQAELMKHKIISGVGELLDASSYVPEADSRLRVSPRQLLVSGPKLLSAGDFRHPQPPADVMQFSVRASADAGDVSYESTVNERPASPAQEAASHGSQASARGLTESELYALSHLLKKFDVASYRGRQDEQSSSGESSKRRNSRPDSKSSKKIGAKESARTRPGRGGSKT